MWNSFVGIAFLVVLVHSYVIGVLFKFLLPVVTEALLKSGGR